MLALPHYPWFSVANISTFGRCCFQHHPTVGLVPLASQQRNSNKQTHKSGANTHTLAQSLFWHVFFPARPNDHPVFRFRPGTRGSLVAWVFLDCPPSFRQHVPKRRCLALCGSFVGKKPARRLGFEEKHRTEHTANVQARFLQVFPRNHSNSSKYQGAPQSQTSAQTGAEGRRGRLVRACASDARHRKSVKWAQHAGTRLFLLNQHALGGRTRTHVMINELREVRCKVSWMKFSTNGFKISICPGLGLLAVSPNRFKQ